MDLVTYTNFKPMHTPNLIAQKHNLFPIEGPGAFADQPNNAAQNLTTLINSIFSFLTIVAGLAFILYFVLGALRWITGGGEEAAVEKAKSQMVNAAIGLIVVMASYAIIGVIGMVLGIDILNFTGLLESF